jgi:hypothetical protein
MLNTQLPQMHNLLLPFAQNLRSPRHLSDQAARNPADEPPTADGVAALQGALVLSLGYILQRGTQGMPEVERMRMIYSMIEKVRADLVKLTIDDIWPRH